MIELAPNRKQGLTLANPIIAASGAVGFASEASDLIALDHFGAIVTAALSLHPRKGSAPPRLLGLSGGLLLNHGDQNPGASRALDRFASVWARRNVPHIAHLVGHTSLGVLARRLERAPSVAAFEYDVADTDALTWLAALRQQTELPLLVRLPYGGDSLAAQAVAAGADALVCIMPPRGAAMDFESGQVMEGALFGPLVKPLAVQTLRAVQASASVPLVACGGVHSRADVDELLAAGASAVMVDSLAWVDPRAVNDILQS